LSSLDHWKLNKKWNLLNWVTSSHLGQWHRPHITLPLPLSPPHLYKIHNRIHIWFLVILHSGLVAFPLTPKVSITKEKQVAHCVRTFGLATKIIQHTKLETRCCVWLPWWNPSGAFRTQCFRSGLHMTLECRATKLWPLSRYSTMSPLPWTTEPSTNKIMKGVSLVSAKESNRNKLL